MATSSWAATSSRAATSSWVRVELRIKGTSDLVVEVLEGTFLWLAFEQQASLASWLVAVSHRPAVRKEAGYN
jgi:hypothetical protein